MYQRTVRQSSDQCMSEAAACAFACRRISCRPDLGAGLIGYFCGIQLGSKQVSSRIAFARQYEYMPTPTIFRPGWAKRANAALDSLLYRVSVYGVPGVIGVVSLVALLAWNGEYTTGGSNDLEFRVLEQTGATLSPAQALARLKEQPAVDHRDTRLSESPFWFSFTTEPATIDERNAIEIPSRHALTASCWDAAELTPLGDADREAGSAA